MLEDLKAKLDALKGCSGTSCQEAEDPSLAEYLKAKLDAAAGGLRPEHQATARLWRPETEEAGSGNSPTPAGRHQP